MVLRRIPIYFLSTIFHDLNPKLASIRYKSASHYVLITMQEHQNKTNTKGIIRKDTAQFAVDEGSLRVMYII